jgi:hypothetical protein
MHYRPPPCALRRAATPRADRMPARPSRTGAHPEVSVDATRPHVEGAAPAPPAGTRGAR